MKKDDFYTSQVKERPSLRRSILEQEKKLIDDLKEFHRKRSQSLKNLNHNTCRKYST